MGDLEPFSDQPVHAVDHVVIAVVWETAFEPARRFARAAADRLYDERVARIAKGDANDSLWAIESIEDYSPEADLPKIKAKVLLINTVEDVANPPELGTVERAMTEIKEGRYVLIPFSDKTHGHFTHYYAAVWKPYLISFMGTLRPAAAAGGTR